MDVRTYIRTCIHTPSYDNTVQLHWNVVKKRSNSVNGVRKSTNDPRSFLRSLSMRYAGILTFMPSHRDTARRGLSALNVRRALNAPMLPSPAPSAPRLTSDICDSYIFDGISDSKYTAIVMFFIYFKCDSNISSYIGFNIC